MMKESWCGGGGAGRCGRARRCPSGGRMSFVPSLTDRRKKGKFAAEARPGIFVGLVLQRGHVWKQDCWVIGLDDLAQF
eukprot:15465172-Alexandrium_andersonii.AAC.1